MNQFKVILIVAFLFLALVLVIDISIYILNNYHQPGEVTANLENQANVSLRDKDVIDRLKRLGYLT
ncbi:MAG: hypothetical protein ABIJ34_07535 [archaeon]